jgi:hypothetical protein
VVLPKVLLVMPGKALLTVLSVLVTDCRLPAMSLIELPRVLMA